MTERMKPPARRTGRTLAGAKKATPPPPPPAAELTPEQYAAEQATPPRATAVPRTFLRPPSFSTSASSRARVSTRRSPLH